MSASPTAQLAAACMVGGGAALAVVGVMLRAQRRQRSLADVLDLPWGEHDIPVEAVTETPAVSALTARLGEAFAGLDRRKTLAAILDRAHLPVRPGEYIVMATVAVLAGGVLLATMTSAPVIGLLGAIGIALAARRWPHMRAARRRRKLEEQLPGAFSLVASSIASGHTFLRSVEMLRQECAPPLSEELDRVVAATMLGQELVDALANLAERYEITDLGWAVHAVRTQQSTGGKISEILHTLAEFMRTREEVRREIQVLSAEGRVSAYVLIALPFLLALALQVIDPAYLRPFFSGSGLVVLGLCGALMLAGYVVIRRMVDIQV